MTTDKPIIEAQNLVKSYKGGKTAVANLSFSLQNGDILALLGPNGAGKTTTIKMLLGLVTPDSGTIKLLGHNMADEKEMRAGLSHVGAVLEGARNAYWRLSAIDNLLYFGGLRKIPQTHLKERAEELLSFLGLEDVGRTEVRKFSRGMQQKLALAIAMLHNPDILLLDEPTLGLDVQAARTLEDRIAELARQGKAIILTTHTMRLAEKLATSLLVINKGRRIAYGNKQELLQRFNTRTTVEVHLEGHLPRSIQSLMFDEFISLQAATDENGGTLITWLEPDQDQVLRLLNFLDNQQQVIRQVVRRESNLEEVFLTLIGEER
jgi:ABC-2 type transport system ATP-binding protein